MSVPHDCESGRRPPTGEVPVFSLQLFLAPPNQQGEIIARAATLPVIGRGRTEPEAMRDVVNLIKLFLTEHVAAGIPIPWTDPPDQAAPDEQERLLAIHL